MHYQQQFSSIWTPHKGTSRFLHLHACGEHIYCHRILHKGMLHWFLVENGTYSQLLISSLCHHFPWTSTTTWGGCAVQWMNEKIKDGFGLTFFFSSGSPTHRKLLLKNKSFALANISSETNFVLIPEDRIWPRYIHMFCQLYKGGERGHSK